MQTLQKVGVNYEPNSFAGPTENVKYNEPPLAIDGDVDRYDRTEGNDHYSQPRELFELMNANQQAQLFSNIAEAMEGVPKEIVERQLALYELVSSEYAAGVKKALS